MTQQMQHELWMRRALLLASYGRSTVSPNPMVGCVIVYNNQIIGEGWHRHYGGGHAEVNAVNDAMEKGHEALLQRATAYVTLEPCAHTGKTPPCADLLIAKQLACVVVCNDDPNPQVAGRGIRRMREAGIEVLTGVCAAEGNDLNRRFFTFFTKKRPYIILKWAETSDGFIGTEDAQPVHISGYESNVLVHRWRAEEDAICVGTTTAIHDNPRLNVRLWNGKNPLRVVIDRHLKISRTHAIFDQTQDTFIYNYWQETPLVESPLRYQLIRDNYYRKIKHGEDELAQIMTDLCQHKVQSVLVEGGRTVLQSFLQENLWDEIRQCQAPQRLYRGIASPVFKGSLYASFFKGADRWSIYRNMY